MKTLIENLCGKLESWGINPITLAKAICIFLILATLVVIFIIFPKLFLVLLVTAICVVGIALIYLMLE
jgi:hypothetical protein